MIFSGDKTQLGTSRNRKYSSKMPILFVQGSKEVGYFQLMVVGVCDCIGLSFHLCSPLSNGLDK